MPQPTAHPFRFEPFQLQLDPEQSRQARRRRDHRYQTVVLPSLRLGTFVLMGALIALHELALGRGSLAPAAIFVAASCAYAALSWALLALFYGRTGPVNLGDVFLVADLLVGVVALVLTGAEQGQMMWLLYLRVIDQSYLSVRRCALFLQLATAGTLAAVCLTGWLEARPIDWPRALTAIALCYGGGLYILAVAQTFAGVRQRLRAAMQTARSAVLSEHERRSEVEQALAQAEQANRTRQEFVSNVSHEIRTPLSGVIGATDLALSHDLPLEVEELLQTVRQSGRNLLFLLNDLLDLSKIDAGRFELDPVECDLEAELASILRTLRPAAVERGTALRVIVDGRLPERITVDPLRLGQVLTNLLSNAIKFTQGGTVTFEAEARGGELSLCVTDTGCGIEPAQVERIFERFVQADGTSARKQGGTGLGLAIVKQLVERMGGRIEVQSQVGVGSRFTVALPLAADPEPEPLLAGRACAVVGIDERARRDQEHALRRAGASLVSRTQAELLVVIDEPSARGLRTAGFEGPCVVLGDHDEPGPEGAVRLREPLLPRELLRALERPDRQPRAVAADESDSHLAGLRVLVADDNRVNRRIVRAYLERWGCEPVEAEDGLEACARAEEAPLDLILMDVQMPGLDGIEAARAIRAREAAQQVESVPIIALTANASLDDREACLAAGMDGHLTKPADFDLLAELIGELAHGSDRPAA